MNQKPKMEYRPKQDQQPPRYVVVPAGNANVIDVVQEEEEKQVRFADDVVVQDDYDEDEQDQQRCPERKQNLLQKFTMK